MIYYFLGGLFLFSLVFQIWLWAVGVRRYRPYENNGWNKPVPRKLLTGPLAQFFPTEERSHK